MSNPKRTLPAAPFIRRDVNDPRFIIDTDYHVIHEDDDLLILDKPAPLAVHPVGVYAEKNLHTLLTNDPHRAGQTIRFVHRLDAETSGVLCAAKTEYSARFLGIEFLNGRVDKKYRALVFGVPDRPEGLIDHCLGFDTSSGFQTVRVRDDHNGEIAMTKYRLIFSTGEYSLMELEPLTGKTHQLRAHLSQIGHPIVGDKIYKDLAHFREYVVNGLNDAMLADLKLPRLALHATELSFRHPKLGERVTYMSPAPSFLLGVR